MTVVEGSPREADVLASVPAASLVGGEWRDIGEGDPIAVEDPATGETLVELPAASVDDGTAALDAAARAQQRWAESPARDRAELLRDAFEAVIERREEFALLITMEMGKPLAEARAEVDYGAEAAMPITRRAQAVS
jgi:succinate-semialdehyde dehydrogenase/glutarate-semialdehyde dehydrogenase